MIAILSLETWNIGHGNTIYQSLNQTLRPIDIKTKSTYPFGNFKQFFSTP